MNSYEIFIWRLAFARDRARMAVAFGHEAEDRYGERHSSLNDARRYVGGWVKAMIEALPD